MSDVTPSTRPIVLGFGILVLFVSAIVGVREYLHNPATFPPDDFVEYWAAGRLNANDRNPYDPDLLRPLQKEAGRDEPEAVMMWNPPWTLTLVMPFALMPARVAQLCWQLLSLCLILLSVDWAWHIYRGPSRLRWVAWLLALGFMPTIFVVRSGQIGAFILFGIVGFLGLVRAGRLLAAGAMAVLLAIKPHLVYLVWIVLLIQGFRVDRRILAGGLVVGVIASLIPLAAHPAVFHDYWEAMSQRPPVQWKSPTLGMLLRLWTEEYSLRLQFIPGLLGLGWLLAWAVVQRGRRWDWVEAFPNLLLVSFVTTSYGAWPFDLVILLPAVIQRSAQLVNQGNRNRTIQGVVLFGAMNLAALLMNVCQVESYWFVWMAPFLLASYWWLRTGASGRN